MSDKIFLKLYSNCVPVRGHGRSTICDLQRNKIHLIPNSLADLFDENGILDINDSSSQLNDTDRIVFNEYVLFLEKKELVFRCDETEIDYFPPLPMEWDFPSLITNCIVDFHTDFSYFNRKLITQLEEVSCNYLQIRMYSSVNVNILIELSELIDYSQIKAYEIILKFSDSNEFLKDLSNFVASRPKIQKITVYAADQNSILKESEYGFGMIVLVKDKIFNHSHCGIIHWANFSVNIETYTESQSFNTCLNRKIGIDIEGNIKNCPSMTRAFGNVRSTTLKDAIANPDFKLTWDLKKVDINICSVCEFRHVCTDCRAFIENPNDQHSKPLKCGYDPYTFEWQSWSLNTLKSDAISFYGLENY